MYHVALQSWVLGAASTIQPIELTSYVFETCDCKSLLV